MLRTSVLLYEGVLTMPADKSTFDPDTAYAASGAAGECPFSNWTVLVVAVAAGLTAIWIGLLLWAAARAVCQLLG